MPYNLEMGLPRRDALTSSPGLGRVSLLFAKHKSGLALTRDCPRRSHLDSQGASPAGKIREASVKTQFVGGRLSSLSLLSVVFLACTQGPESYSPLQQGRTWEYQVSSGHVSGPRNTTKMVVTNFGPREIQGKKLMARKLDIRGESHFSFVGEDSDGVYEFASQSPEAAEPVINVPPLYFLRRPIQVGTTWHRNAYITLGGEKTPVVLNSTIETIDEVVTVPAGTFKGCVKVKSVGAVNRRIGFALGVATIRIEHYNWYAPGVGNIKNIIKEMADHFMLDSREVAVQLESFKK